MCLPLLFTFTDDENLKMEYEYPFYSCHQKRKMKNGLTSTEYRADVNAVAAT